LNCTWRPRANEENARGSGQHTQRGPQFSSGQTVRRLCDPRNVFLIQIEAVEIRAPSVGIFLVSRILFGGNLEQALPETLAAKYAAF
jgi:hypothetical protein